jgi:hypothetical protein
LTIEYHHYIICLINDQTIYGILTLVFDLVCKQKSTSEEVDGSGSPEAVMV